MLIFGILVKIKMITLQPCVSHSKFTDMLVVFVFAMENGLKIIMLQRSSRGLFSAGAKEGNRKANGVHNYFVLHRKIENYVIFKMKSIA